MGGVRMGARVSDAFSLSRASWASGVHVKHSVFLKSRYRGKPFSPRREMNRLRDARHPMTLYTPFRSRIGPIRVMAETLSGLGSTPRWETMKPKSMPRGTPNTHFSGLSFTPLARRQSNAILRSATRSSAFLDFTTISSTYAYTLRP